MKTNAHLGLNQSKTTPAVQLNPMAGHTRRVTKMARERGATTLASFFPFLGQNSPACERVARATSHGTAYRSVRRRTRSPEGERATVEPVHDGALKRLWAY
jgi:hypothetical protein